MFDLDKELRMWGMGISEADNNLISQCAGSELVEHVYSENNEYYSGHQEEMPLLIWVGAKLWLDMKKNNPDACRTYSTVPKVLLLEENYSLEELENALDDVFEVVIRPPLNKKSIFNVLRKLMEARNLHYDIRRLTQEMNLERDLFNKKSANFDFMIKFYQNIESSKNPLDLVSNVKSLLSENFPIRSMHLAWWGSHSSKHMDIYLDCIEKDSPSAKLWLKSINDTVGKILPTKIATQNVQCLNKINNNWQAPEVNKTLILPLSIHNENCGIIMLGLSKAWNQGRDQSLALEGALANFALHLEYMMQNAYLFTDHEETKAYIINLPC